MLQLYDIFIIPHFTKAFLVIFMIFVLTNKKISLEP